MKIEAWSKLNHNLYQKTFVLQRMFNFFKVVY